LNGELNFLSNDVELRFDRAGLAHLPDVLRKRALRLASEALGGPLSYDQTQILIEGLEIMPSGSITAEGGTVAISWVDEHIDIRNLLPSTPYRYSITVPGETISDEFGWQFTAYEEPFLGESPVRASLATTFDRAAIRGQLYFRTVHAGDTMQPLGFDRRRKMSDILSEAKLTQAARTRLPIVCDMLGPIWAPGVCLDARVRPTASTERAIQIRFGTLLP
jgi:tRNA(Ile)-lysidine synthase